LTIEALTHLLGVIVWPVVVLVAIAVLRREVAGLFGRVRQIEGPGSLKVSLDPNKVEQIIKEGRKENVPPAAVAERIVRAATILDKREARILRALLDDDGRALYSYQTDYYRPALESLLAKGYVRKVDRGFALTQEGRRVTREYIQGVLQGLADLDAAKQRGAAEA
jgi:ribosomal protein S19E (S16A)